MLFDGDIQERMREGNTSRENPSKPHKEIYPMLFNLTIENGTFFYGSLIRNQGNQRLHLFYVLLQFVNHSTSRKNQSF
ncbi:hypothetical protein MtrunA17_Chr4g0009371 [Medicago truncatula]|uniref:Uncharacterized protein n=1 Tax=Medicago truncatula TaxID=3880 RepID=A0A396I0D9_MEDTR|nr:hypothetical protein MtrunA17_Chr4g0009371 [Medicago truncatula]